MIQIELFRTPARGCSLAPAENGRDFPRKRVLSENFHFLLIVMAQFLSANVLARVIITNMKWEYIVREFSVQDSSRILLLEEFLNEAGTDGWELVLAANVNGELHTSGVSETRNANSRCSRAAASDDNLRNR